MAGGGQYKIIVYNMLGENVYEKIFIEKKAEVNVNLPKGIYQLRIETNAGVGNKKIIIQ